MSKTNRDEQHSPNYCNKLNGPEACSVLLGYLYCYNAEISSVCCVVSKHSCATSNKTVNEGHDQRLFPPNALEFAMFGLLEYKICGYNQ